MSIPKGFTTKILHGDRQQPIEHGSLHKPVHMAISYGYSTAENIAQVFQGKAAGYAYGRQSNPTTKALEQKITVMEEGLDSICFTTGMAAISAVMTSLLRQGDHLIASQFLFGNTNSFFQDTLTALGIEVSFVDATSLEAVQQAYRDNTRAVFVETIANPCTQISDLKGLGVWCAQQGILYMVDNTMTSPALFRPRDVGASLVINALSKYMGGHGQALGGSVTTTDCYDWSTFPNIYDHYKKGDSSAWGLLQIRKKGLRDQGGTLAPQVAHDLAIGMETLALRLQRSCENAQRLALFLQAQPLVDHVFYPGLDNHPQHERASALFSGYGALMSIRLQESVEPLAWMNHLKTVIIASNLGDNRTLSIPVAHTIFYEMGPERRASMGITDGTIRIAVGIEDYADLEADFSQALAAV